MSASTSAGTGNRNLPPGAQSRQQPSVGSRLALVLALIALLLAGATLGLVLTGAANTGKLDAQTKADLLAISHDLKALKSKPLVFTQPIQATARLTGSIPASALLPNQLTVPVTMNITIAKTVRVQTPSLGVVLLPIDETIPISTTATLKPAGFGTPPLEINQTVPVTITTQSTLTLANAMGPEIDDISARLENLAK